MRVSLSVRTCPASLLSRSPPTCVDKWPQAQSPPCGHRVAVVGCSRYRYPLIPREVSCWHWAWNLHLIGLRRSPLLVLLPHPSRRHRAASRHLVHYLALRLPPVCSIRRVEPRRTLLQPVLVLASTARRSWHSGQEDHHPPRP